MPRHLANTIPRSETNTYKDLRSRRRLHNRQSKQSAKYYGYRGVDPSWVDQPYISFPGNNHSPVWSYEHPNIHPSADPLLSAPEAKISTWTKRDMYLDRSTDIWPLDRRHHVGKHIREKHSRKWDELAMGRRMRQRNREWEFAIHDARDLARLKDDDTDTVYWELESRYWDDVEQVSNDKGEPPHALMDLDGERFFDAWFENGEFFEQFSDIGHDAASDWPRDGFLCLEGGDDDDEDGFYLIFDDTADEDVAVWSSEDGYEMVEVG